MDVASLTIWFLAGGLAVVAFLRRDRAFRLGLKVAWLYVLRMAPLIVMAVLASGFFSVIVPADVVGAWLGKATGLKGIAIASLLGGFTPGGPMASFPIVAVLYDAGAGRPQLIAFLTAWSVFAFNRIIAFEVPLIGMRFALVRIGSSFFLPPVAGVLAAIAETHLSFFG